MKFLDSVKFLKKAIKEVRLPLVALFSALAFMKPTPLWSKANVFSVGDRLVYYSGRTHDSATVTQTFPKEDQLLEVAFDQWRGVPVTIDITATQGLGKGVSSYQEFKSKDSVMHADGRRGQIQELFSNGMLKVESTQYSGGPLFWSSDKAGELCQCLQSPEGQEVCVGQTFTSKKTGYASEIRELYSNGKVGLYLTTRQMSATGSLDEGGLDLSCLKDRSCTCLE